MAEKYYNLSKQQMNNIYKYSEEIYSNICLLRLFCKEYYDVDDVFIIKPILEYTHKSSDLLYATLIDMQSEIEK